ncbi:MAG TPA: hypothetical protein VKM55_27735 [Candidatus Lokiarchaeia archaeon]|nr:hypothetical protein [Candidatus Lokiarchaeia archaeon]
MAKKAAVLGKNVRKSLITSARKWIQEISQDYSGLECTRAVDTYIMEKIRENPLKITVIREDQALMSANLLWVTEKEEGGVVLYLDNKKFLYPTNENIKGAFFSLDKKKVAGIVEIEMHPNPAPCAICGKPMEIFDEITSCPSCGAMSHILHLEEWIRMKGSCSSCQVQLAINENNKIVLA